MTRASFTHDGVSYLGGVQCLSRKETPDWLICILIPEADVLDRVHRSNRETVLVGLAILLGAALVSLYVSRQIAQPLEQLARETEEIGRLQVEPLPVVRSLVHEVQRLAVAVEETKTSLRSFRKYVPAELVRVLLSSGREAALGGESRTVSIYFCDLANFTAVSEKLAPQELVQHLAAYFDTFSGQILATGGTVDKYVGDAIMAFWGAPVGHPQHAVAACTAAIRNQESLKELRGKWKAEGKPLLFARIGIHLGEVVVGNIGSPARLNYTVMGDAVNLASRLEGLNKYYGTEVLISESVYREAQPAVVARPVDWVSVKGKTEAVLIYELLGLKGDAAGAGEDLAELSARALSCYRARDWAEATQLFEQVLRIRPEDGPARLLIGRCLSYQASPPPEGWDGVHRMEHK
jgi:adenylate cyclase